MGLDILNSRVYDRATTANHKTTKGVKTMPTEKEIKRIELATVYELRLLLTGDDKTEYTKEELLQILDQYARDKNTPV